MNHRMLNILLLVSCCSIVINANDVPNFNETESAQDSIIGSYQLDQDQDEIEIGSDDQEIEEIQLDEETAADASQVNVGELVMLDKIEAVVADGDRSEAIATSDVARRAFDGQHHDLNDVINENLLDILADKFKITVDDEDIDKYLLKMKMPHEQVRAIAESSGYSNMAEFYGQFKKMYRSQNALNYKVQSELVFAEDVIAEYYNENPVVNEAMYVVELATVPFDENKEKAQQLKELNEFARGKRQNKKIIWQDPIELKQSEVAEQNSFLFAMKDNEIVVKETESGFDLFRMKQSTPKKILTLQERKQEIITTLRNQKYDQIVEKVLKDLRTKYVVLEPTYIEYPAPTDIAELV